MISSHPSHKSPIDNELTTGVEPHPETNIRVLGVQRGLAYTLVVRQLAYIVRVKKTQNCLPHVLTVYVFLFLARFDTCCHMSVIFLNDTFINNMLAVYSDRFHVDFL